MTFDLIITLGLVKRTQVVTRRALLALTCETDFNLSEAGAAPEEILRKLKPALSGTNKAEHLKV